MLQHRGVGIDGLFSACQAQVKGVVHVGVAGGKLSNVQPTEMVNQEERDGKKIHFLILSVPLLQQFPNVYQLASSMHESKLNVFQSL